MLAARWFVGASARQLAQALTTFAAVFSALASTGLLLTGRLGFAIVTVGRHRDGGPRAGAGRPARRRSDGAASRRGRRPASRPTCWRCGSITRPARSTAGSSAGDLAGRELASLGLTELLALLAEARREDPPSVPLLEAYLDRRAPDWRESAAGGTAASRRALWTNARPWTFWACRRVRARRRSRPPIAQLMARLHPDHGGSAYLAAQLNQARDYLLRHQKLKVWIELGLPRLKCRLAHSYKHGDR